MWASAKIQSSSSKLRCKLVMCVIVRILWGLLVSVSIAVDAKELRFNEKGEFKILQISDAHYANGKDTPCRDVLPEEFEFCSDLNTTDYIRRFIRVENPDLILFGGDNIHGTEPYDYKKAMDEVFEPAIESNIPWTAVIGNWDVDIKHGIPRQQMMEYLVGLKNTLSRMEPANLKENETIHGSGNYNLQVAGVEGSTLQNKSVLNLYLLDSGDYTVNDGVFGYDYIHPGQQLWFSRTSKELQEEYMSEPQAQAKPAPGLVFFHIPLPEVMNISESEMVGVKQEGINCSFVNAGFFDTMVAAGDIKAAFTGHGHVNDFCGKLSGIHLCYSGGFGYHGYGIAGWPRRARIINIKLERLEDGNWGGVNLVETWKRIHDDHLSIIDPQILWTSSASDRSSSAFNPLRESK